MKINNELNDCKTVLDVEKVSFEIAQALNYYGFNKFSSVFVVENVNDYFQVLKQYKNKKKKINGKVGQKSYTEYVFRGISNSEQKYSGITRCALKNSSSNIAFQELEEIKKFEQNSSFLIKGNLSPVDLVAAAQHYGMRTRLTDWSYSPLVATLFSLHGNLEGAEYYAVMVCDIKQQVFVQDLPYQNGEFGISNKYMTYAKMLHYLEKTFGSQNIEDYKTYMQNVFVTSNIKFSLDSDDANIKYMIEQCAQRLYDGKMLFLKTSFSNDRIVGQKGLFQLAVKPKDFKYMANQFSDIHIVLFPQKVRRQIIDFCEHLGVNYYGLAPDLQSITMEIHRRQKDLSD